MKFHKHQFYNSFVGLPSQFLTADSHYYDAEGKLYSKTTFEYSNQFTKKKSCLPDNACDTTYVGLDNNGIENIIGYNNKDLASIDRKIRKAGLLVKEISYDFCRPLEEGGMFRNPLYTGDYKATDDCFYNSKAKK